METNIFNDLQCVTNFEALMFDKSLDFTLIHTFAKDVMSNKGMYILLNAQASRLLNNEVQNGGGTKGWATKYFKHYFCI
jgi:hypothetical protein